MSVTVAEMLSLPGFSDMKVIAGEKGIYKRRITSVTVVDAPDATPWVKGGEFVIGSGYIFSINDMATFMGFVEGFNDLGISAIGIKVSRFLKKVPEEILIRAEELELPIIDIPVHYAFADIIDPVMSVVLNRTVEKLRFSETVSRSFFELITGGGEMHEILSHLHKFIQRNIAYHDLISGETFFSSANEDFRSDITENPLRQNLDSFPYVMVKQDNKIYGYIMFNAEAEEMDNETWEITLCHARTALLLYSQKQILKAEVESRYRNEFVQDILFKNLRFEKELWNRASLFGWDLDRSQVVAVFDIDNYKSHFANVPEGDKADMLHALKQRIYNIVIRSMSAVFFAVPYTTMSDSVVFLIPCDNADKIDIFKQKLNEIFTKISEEVRRNAHFTLSIGIGNIKASVFKCHESYTEARKALEMTRMTFGVDRITWWGELGVYKILGNLDNTDEAKEFCNEYLGKLISSDRKRSTQYIRTLEVIIRNNFSLKISSEELSIHYNTLKHRLNKIEEISGLNIYDSEDRINITLSLKLYHMNNILDFMHS